MINRSDPEWQRRRLAQVKAQIYLAIGVLLLAGLTGGIIWQMTP